MSAEKPSIVTQTVLNNEATRDVAIQAKRRVTYVITVKTAKKLTLPYAVAIDGVVQDAFKNKPKKVAGEVLTIIVKDVKPGAKVNLFLNSDAHPRFRKEPVYSVTPVERDLVVNIVEKPGRHNDTDAPVRSISASVTTLKSDARDIYSAVLTGDIWMKISHRYSEQEVDSFLSADTNLVVRAAVKKIYAGLTQNSFEIDLLSVQPGTGRNTVKIKLVDGSNPHENISKGYNFFTEGLTRVHPAAYAAVIEAAIEAGVNSIRLTSSWRPMKGSIAHRAGLGLDMDYIGATHINRKILRTSDAPKSSSVSETEKSLYAVVVQKKEQEDSANKLLVKAQADAKKIVGGAANLIAAKEKVKDSKDAVFALTAERKKAEIAWSAERDKNEPIEMRNFRMALIKRNSVAQVFDPWLMDLNTHDKITAESNRQMDENEKLHSDHLHITVYEPNIL